MIHLEIPLTCLQGAGQCHSPGDTAGIAELDVSNDGSRLVVGQLVSTDSAGNRYFHLYMHIGNDPDTIDLTPGATDGALYDGMTEDGSIVYFSTQGPTRHRNGSGHRLQRRHLSELMSLPRGATLTRVTDRYWRHRQHRYLQPGSQHRQRTLEHCGGRTSGLQRRYNRWRRRGRGGVRGRSTSSALSSSTVPATGPQIAQSLRGQYGLGAALHRDPRVEPDG